ncbi:MAG: glycoside hydrolase family 127 protein, partial [Planctomycetota bacterium]|nr:glycoside hydrolase family 127 protein [Planctomycetota bacterium]
AKPRFSLGQGRGLLAGIPLIRCSAWRSAGVWRKALYQPATCRRKRCRVTAIPYFLWANREPGEMIVWVRKENGA